MASHRRLVSLIAIGLCVSGCATVDSAKIGGQSAAADGSGIAYFLPRQLAKVTAKRSDLSLDKQIKALGEAELAVSIAKAQVAAAKSAVKETEDSLVAKGDIPAVRDLLLARLAEQKKALAAAELAVTKKEAERKKAGDDVVEAASRPSGPDPKQQKVSVGIELLPPSADPAEGYRLNPRHSAFRDDEHKLAISPGGLLTSLDIVAADRTADALVELAALTGAVAGPRPVSGRPQDDPPRACPEEISAIVDFADSVEVDRLNDTLLCMGAKVRLLHDPVSFAAPGPSRAGLYDGVLYRTPVEVLVQIEKCPLAPGACILDNQWLPSVTLALSLPQAGPISYLPQNAGLFTKTTYGTVFKDGILISYNSNRPSEVLHVAATPMRLVGGFFDGASKIISLRTGPSNAQADALAARKKLADADLAALQAEAKRDAVNRCIIEKATKGEATESCFANQ